MTRLRHACRRIKDGVGLVREEMRNSVPTAILFAVLVILLSPLVFVMALVRGPGRVK